MSKRFRTTSEAKGGGHSAVRASWADGQKHWGDRPLEDDHAGFVPYDAWAKFRRGQLSSRSIGEKSIAGYRYMWTTWLKYLESRAPRINWWDASTSDVAGFLTSLRSSSIGKDKASPISRARYRRILDDVYGHAVKLGVEGSARKLAANPVDGLGVSELLPNSERPQSLRFTDQAWEKLLHHLPQNAADAGCLRDAAILRLVMFDGFCVSDMMNMKITDIRFISDPLQPGNAGSVVAFVDVTASAGKEPRTVRLSDRSALSLKDWISARNSLEVGEVSNVFINLRKKTMLTAKSIFIIVQHFIAVACLGESARGELPAHMGPNALRNGCIQRWIEQRVPFADIASRLGQEIRSLERLLDPTDKDCRERYLIERAAATKAARQE